MSLGSAFRFALVGGSATLVYLLISIGLAGERTGMAPTAAHVLALLVATAFSYAGHHRFTFRLTSGHERHLRRFLTCSGILLALTTVLSLALTDLLRVDHHIAALSVALIYPPASYLINALWSFRLRE
ncbi:GtrA family protein [Skermanella pratensis]|uniref:GtrA family protein n=1 Tax=Skermanella pratensis TaxID=2233999 RepID=UPI0017887B24|nr:GtrA family protein [Skermanella pratensis]